MNARSFKGSHKKFSECQPGLEDADCRYRPAMWRLPAALVINAGLRCRGLLGGRGTSKVKPGVRDAIGSIERTRSWRLQVFDCRLTNVRYPRPQGLTGSRPFYFLNPPSADLKNVASRRIDRLRDFFGEPQFGRLC
jgi:hypothetical protein